MEQAYQILSHLQIAQLAMISVQLCIHNYTDTPAMQTVPSVGFYMTGGCCGKIYIASVITQQIEYHYLY